MHARAVTPILFAAIAIAFTPGYPATAQELWLSPPAEMSDPANTDLALFAGRPEAWSRAASHARVFSVPVHYLVQPPPEIVADLLRRLASDGLKLDVAVLALPVDKSRCDGEGMVWPGEAKLAAQRLRERGVPVDSFSFDLPLTDGSISTQPHACRLSVSETASRLAQTVRDLREYYPQAKMIDAEVPTGMPVARWTAILTEWLADYRRETGAELDGFTMDAWYEGDWQESVRQTLAILRSRGIHAGAFIDASAGPALDAASWVAEARRVDCAYQTEDLPVDYLVVANWLDPRVPNLPESDPDTLTGLLDWVAAKSGCVPPPQSTPK